MNTFGNVFRVSLFGESHGEYIGIVLDGVPPGLDINQHDFMNDIERRKSGQKGTTTRIESDEPQLISGVYKGKSTGAPLTILFKNENKRSEDYEHLKNTPRPGHADFTAMKKYNGFNDTRGGGHFSGRLTLCLVAAGVIAKKIINPVVIKAHVAEVNGQTNIEQALQDAIHKNDSVGGIINCSAENIPIGLGEPFFDSIESLLAHAIFAIPAVKGIEFGAGFSSTKMYGSQHNDAITNAEGKTRTNNAGGIAGGISNGNELRFRVAIKPTSSTPQPQHSFNFETQKVENIEVKGRHDLCIALRVPVVVEAVTAIVLADLSLRHKAYRL